MATLTALRSFHTLERHVFQRLLDLGKSPALAKQIMALWLWLESIGHHEMVRKISAGDDRFLDLVANEAVSCLAVVQSDNPWPAAENNILVTAAVLESAIALHFFDMHREIARKGILRNVNGVCHLVFDDLIEERAVREAQQAVAEARLHLGEGQSYGGGEMGRLFVPYGEGSSSGASYNGRPVARDVPWRTFRSNLNPLASPWTPRAEPIPEDERCLFLTFSRGYPLTAEEIFTFFTSTFGDCVDTIYIDESQKDEHPLFGKLVFYSPTMIPIVLNGEPSIQFVVNGKQLRCRIYTPRR